MRVLLIVCAALAVAAAASIPSSEETKPFASQRLSTKPKIATKNDELFYGTFFTRQDHSRPQNRVQVLFVSFE